MPDGKPSAGLAQSPSPREQARSILYAALESDPGAFARTCATILENPHEYHCSHDGALDLIRDVMEVD